MFCLALNSLDNIQPYSCSTNYRFPFLNKLKILVCVVDGMKCYDEITVPYCFKGNSDCYALYYGILI